MSETEVKGCESDSASLRREDIVGKKGKHMLSIVWKLFGALKSDTEQTNTGLQNMLAADTNQDGKSHFNHEMAPSQ